MGIIGVVGVGIGRRSIGGGQKVDFKGEFNCPKFKRDKKRSQVIPYFLFRGNLGGGGEKVHF